MKKWNLPSYAVAVMMALYFSVTTANATIITCEPDDFAAGADLTNACSMATLSVDGLAATNKVRSQTADGASTGERGFADETDVLWASVTNTLRVDFADFMQFVSIDLIPNDPADPGFLRAFDDADLELEEILLPGNQGTNIPATAAITRGSADISYILVSGDGQSSSSFLDNLRYSTELKEVSEPGTMALFGLGLIGLCLARRREDT